MKPLPTDEEMAEVYNALMSVSGQVDFIYGVPATMIVDVVNYWARLAAKEMNAKPK